MMFLKHITGWNCYPSCTLRWQQTCNIFWYSIVLWWYIYSIRLPSLEADLGFVRQHKLLEHLLHATLWHKAGECVHHQLRGVWEDQVMEARILRNAGCLWIKDRIVHLKLVNKRRGASEAKQLCGWAGRNPVKENRIEKRICNIQKYQTAIFWAGCFETSHFPLHCILTIQCPPGPDGT